MEQKSEEIEVEEKKKQKAKKNNKMVEEDEEAASEAAAGKQDESSQSGALADASPETEATPAPDPTPHAGLSSRGRRRIKKVFGMSTLALTMTECPMHEA